MIGRKGDRAGEEAENGLDWGERKRDTRKLRLRRKRGL